MESASINNAIKKMRKCLIEIENNGIDDFRKDNILLANSALDSLEKYNNDHKDWPEDLPVSATQVQSILMNDLSEFKHERLENETLVMARTRLLIDRILVENKKRALLWAAAKVFSQEDTVLLKKAEDYADDAHLGQKRDSGEPYIIHPLEVANYILNMDMDSEAVIAGILHDTVEDNDEIEIGDITREFGADISLLVDGVTKLTKASFSGEISKEQYQAENIKKMFLAMAKDLRVIPIKLADRLHNMRTLEYCRTDKKIRKAEETLEIYAPLAHRLGMGQLKSELEDLSFMHINPEEYEKLQKKVQLMNTRRGTFLDNAMDRIKIRLKESGIECGINGRPKHIYSIYKKMQNKNIPFENILDLIALRVIVETKDDCYSVLGIVQELWKPVPNTFKDYISVPKPNGYQSIHITLTGENGMRFEVQIRTEEMHKVAEFGIAAHWKYKEGRTEGSSLDTVLDWFRNLMSEKVEDSGEFVSILKFDLFTEYVYVFTPNGEILDLAAGSTPIDFAYKIHSELGNKCTGAKVNERIVPLDYKLKTGDIVDIIRSNTSIGPKRDWLNFVATHTARNKIKAWFKKELKSENIERGKSMLEKEAKNKAHTLSKICNLEVVLELFTKISINSLDDLYAAVGYGSLSTAQVIPRLIDKYNETHKEEQPNQKELIAQNKSTQKTKQSTQVNNAVIVRGEKGMLVRMARCCTPVPGDDIIGYTTRGRGVSVHRSDCSNIVGFEGFDNRFIEVEWESKQSETQRFIANIRVIANDRPALIMDISRMFVNLNINLLGINSKADSSGKATFELKFNVSDADHLNNIINMLKKIESIEYVYRVRS